MIERFLIDGLMPISALKPSQAQDFSDDDCSGHLLKDFYNLHPEKKKFPIRLQNCGASGSQRRLGDFL